jgi:hypothetical protein
MNNNQIKTIKLEQTCQEFYGVTNDTCPICGKKFITPSNIVKFRGKAYHLTCHNELTRGDV